MFCFEHMLEQSGNTADKGGLFLAQIQAGEWPQSVGFEASNTRDGTRVQALCLRDSML